jgi:urease accessory protein
MLLSTGSGKSCSSNLKRVGRDGRLWLRFARRGEATALVASRFTLPLQALEPVTQPDGTAYLMLLNPSGGLVGGDHLTTKIFLEPRAHVCLTTPSATKVYRTIGEPAVQETCVELGASAVFEYVPDHVIPHAGAALRQVLRLTMGTDSRAIIADGFAAGRVGRGESWRFAELDSVTTVIDQGRPLFLNRTRVTPESISPSGWGKAQGFNYVASLLAVADRWSGWERLKFALDERLADFPLVYGGVSLLAQGGCYVRYLTCTAHELGQTTRALWVATRRLLLGLDAFDLRKT